VRRASVSATSRSGAQSDRSRQTWPRTSLRRGRSRVNQDHGTHGTHCEVPPTRAYMGVIPMMRSMRSRRQPFHDTGIAGPPFRWRATGSPSPSESRVKRSGALRRSERALLVELDRRARHQRQIPGLGIPTGRSSGERLVEVGTSELATHLSYCTGAISRAGRRLVAGGLIEIVRPGGPQQVIVYRVPRIQRRAGSPR
jgi:hypothetical protein